jgi:hypothetical protein
MDMDIDIDKHTEMYKDMDIGIFMDMNIADMAFTVHSHVFGLHVQYMHRLGLGLGHGNGQSHGHQYGYCHGPGMAWAWAWMRT